MLSTSAKFKVLKLAPEDFLYKEGEVPKAMYLVKTGVISVFNQKKDKSLELVRIQAGHLVGELGFFKLEPFTSSAKALVETEIIEIPYQEVQKEFDAFPAWSKILLNTMSSQVIRFSRELKQFRSATSSQDDMFYHNFLRYLGGFSQALDIYGEQKGGVTTLEKTSLRVACTYLNQLVPSKMDQFVKNLKELELVKIIEQGDDYIVEVSAPERIRKLTKDLGYYLAKHSKLLNPSSEDVDFITALKTVGQTLEANPKGLVKVQAAPVMAELKNMQSKANMTIVDSLIDQGVSIQKQSGQEGVEFVFHKDDILSLADVWDLVSRARKQSPL